MAWFFRAVETAHGRWECRHGEQVYDAHVTLGESLEHLRSLVHDQRGAVQLFVHTLDGKVRSEGLSEPVPPADRPV
jgi:hypothetical protein